MIQRTARTDAQQLLLEAANAGQKALNSLPLPTIHTATGWRARLQMFDRAPRARAIPWSPGG